MNGGKMEWCNRLWSRLRRVAPETWLCALIGCAAALYALRSAAFFLRLNASLHFDDGYVTAIGERLLDGHWLPYVDAASHRGPVMYWLAALSQALGGRMQWYGVRALTSFAFLTTAAGIALASCLAGRRLVGAFAGLTFVFVSICLLEIQTVFGLVGEAIATPWLVVSFLLSTWALARPQAFGKRCALLGAAGFTAALAGLTKQTYLAVVAPQALWALAAGLSEPEASRARRWALPGALALGWSLPLAGVLLVYAWNGELGTFHYWFYRYNVDVYMAPFQDTKVLMTIYRWTRENGPLSLSAVVLLSSVASQHLPPVLASLRGLPRAYARRGFELTVMLQALLGVAAGLSTLRFWPQYYLPPIPWFALLLALSLEHGLGYSPHQERGGPRRWGPLFATTLLLGSFCVSMLEQNMYTLRRQREKGSWANALPEPACEHIDRLAPPGEPIFIWGFDADLYVTCRRHSASRYVYSTLVAGIVPPDWRINLARSARDSIGTLISELRSARPPLVLDSPSRLRGASITQITPLHRYLRKHYCPAESFQSKDGRTLSAWLRRDLCPPPAAGQAEQRTTNPPPTALAGDPKPSG